MAIFCRLLRRQVARQVRLQAQHKNFSPVRPLRKPCRVRITNYSILLCGCAVGASWTGALEALSSLDRRERTLVLKQPVVWSALGSEFSTSFSANPLRYRAVPAGASGQSARRGSYVSPPGYNVIESAHNVLEPGRNVLEPDLIESGDPTVSIRRRKRNLVSTRASSTRSHTPSSPKEVALGLPETQPQIVLNSATMRPIIFAAEAQTFSQQRGGGVTSRS